MLSLELWSGHWGINTLINKSQQNLFPFGNYILVKESYNNKYIGKIESMSDDQKCSGEK